MIDYDVMVFVRCKPFALQNFDILWCDDYSAILFMALSRYKEIRTDLINGIYERYPLIEFTEIQRIKPKKPDILSPALN